MLRTKLALMGALVVLAAFGAYMAAGHGVRAQSPGPASEGPFRVEDAQWALPPEAAARMQGQQPLAVSLPKTEDFEGAWPNDWGLYGDSAMPIWGPEECKSHGGTYSGWSAAYGPTALEGCVTDYPNNQNVWMEYGPFSLVGATSAGVDFWFDIAIHSSDSIWFLASTDGIAFCGWGYSGNSGGWLPESFDFADMGSSCAVPNVLGETDVWFAFMFYSDGSITDRGAFIDDIEIWADFGGGPTPTPTPTPPPALEGCTLSGPLTRSAADLVAPAAAADQAWRALPHLLPDGLARRDVPPPAANVVDSAATSWRQPLVPVIETSFDGLDYNDNPFGVSPPDPQLAVGPNHVFEMVNVMGRISDKSGTVDSTFTLRSFFGLPGGLWIDTDPKIIYDATSGRWFASYLASDNATIGAIYFAVSQSSDPTGTWNVYHCDYADILPDYPGIGLTDDKFTVSSNLYPLPSGDFVAEHTFVVEKADIVAGVSAASVGLYNFPYQPDRFTVRPAHSLSSVSDQYLATFDVTSGFLPATELTVIRISGTPDGGNVTESTWNVALTNPDGTPPLNETADGGTIDAIYRLLETVWRDGRLWGASTAACTPPGDDTERSCAHLIEVDTGSQTLLNDIMFGAVGEYFSWPAIRTDALNNLHVVLTHTKPDIYAEAVVTGRLATDAPNTMSGSSVLAPGEVLHDSGRWGDYLGAAVDPSDPCKVWVVGEYAKDTGASGPSGNWDWGTWIGGLRHAGCADTDSDGVLDSLDNCVDDPNPGQENADAAFDNGPGLPGASLTLPLHDITVPNGDPADTQGDACETDGDIDNDGLPDSEDTNPLTGAGLCGGLTSDDGHPNPAGGDVTNDDDGDGDPAPNMGTDSADNGPSWDTDGDGFLDGAECALGYNPRDSSSKPSKLECGGEGDTDGDGLQDNWETCGWGTDPNVVDSDGDGLGDCVEATDVNGDGNLSFTGDLYAYAQAFYLWPPPGHFGRTMDFDLDKNGTLSFSGDVYHLAVRYYDVVTCQ